MLVEDGAQLRESQKTNDYLCECCRLKRSSAFAQMKLCPLKEAVLSFTTMEAHGAWVFLKHLLTQLCFLTKPTLIACLIAFHRDYVPTPLCELLS